MRLVVRLMISFAIVCVWVASLPAGQLARHRTRYYELYTDLQGEQLREVELRLDRLAEQCLQAMNQVPQATDQPMPVYLYKNAEDYHATGAPTASAGYFNGRELVVLASEPGPRSWYILQHEAFHQLARRAFRTDLPVWLSEGLAEYAGEAVFTGDGYIFGLIPQWRLARVRQSLADNSFRPLGELMNLTHRQWNSDLAIVNYDQGWSMVQYLLHGDGGKYHQPFSQFLSKLRDDQPWRQAWEEFFPDTKTLERNLRGYFTALEDDPTADLYAQAVLQTLSGFMARAGNRGQAFQTFGDFLAAAKSGRLAFPEQDWLPPSLLLEAIVQAERMQDKGCSFAILAEAPGLPPRLVCILPDGRRLESRR